MFKRSLCIIGLVATIVPGGSSYGQTPNFRREVLSKVKTEVEKVPVVQQAEKRVVEAGRSAAENITDAGAGLGAASGGTGILCHAINCSGSPANAQPQPTQTPE